MGVYARMLVPAEGPGSEDAVIGRGIVVDEEVVLFRDASELVTAGGALVVKIERGEVGDFIVSEWIVGRIAQCFVSDEVFVAEVRLDKPTEFFYAPGPGETEAFIESGAEAALGGTSQAGGAPSADVASALAAGAIRVVDFIGDVGTLGWMCTIFRRCSH